MVRYAIFALVFGLAALPSAMRAQQTAPMSDGDYLAKIKGAAPAGVVSGATVIRVGKDGSMRMLQTGANGFTCMMLDPATPMCADRNAMAWAHAMMTHASPPAALGFVYMLAGDDGASNTDPAATAPSPTNHWIKSGPHVMLVGPAVTTMGYPMSADPDPTKPYVMWANTPYAHLMIPISVP